MRIVYVVPPSPDSYGLHFSRLWEINLYRPLIDLGHEVMKIDVDFSGLIRHGDPTIEEHREYQRTHRPQVSAQLLDAVKRAHREKPIDLFFSYLYSSHAEPEAIREIGRLGIVTMNWYCNASYQFDLVEEIAPAFHYCLVPEKFRIEDYRRIGANPVYCQEAANPNFYRPFELPVRYDVIFAGQAYGNRPGYVRRLAEAGVNVRAFGSGWQRRAPFRGLGVLMRTAARLGVLPRDWGGPLSDEEYRRIFSRTRVALGFTQVGSGTGDSRGIRQVRLRDFEAPMSGAFYLVERFDELAEFFEPGKEIVFFEDPDDLVDKARYFLTHEQERQRIRSAGMRRAREEHSWHQRFKQVFAVTGLS